jgi:uncharacterized protein (DUF849 family)
MHLDIVLVTIGAVTAEATVAITILVQATDTRIFERFSKCRRQCKFIRWETYGGSYWLGNRIGERAVSWKADPKYRQPNPLGFQPDHLTANLLHRGARFCAGQNKHNRSTISTALQQLARAAKAIMDGQSPGVKSRRCNACYQIPQVWIA